MNEMHVSTRFFVPILTSASIIRVPRFETNGRRPRFNASFIAAVTERGRIKAGFYIKREDSSVHIRPDGAPRTREGPAVSFANSLRCEKTSDPLTGPGGAKKSCEEVRF